MSISSLHYQDGFHSPILSHPYNQDDLIKILLSKSSIMLARLNLNVTSD